MQKGTSNSRNKKTTTTTDKKSETPVVVKNEVVTTESSKEQDAEKAFDGLMSHYHKMELLRDRYNRLKVKRDNVKTQLAEMEILAKELRNDFVDDDDSEEKQFHFSIKLTNEDDHRIGVISKMNKPEVVIPFTRLLLLEIEKILESFQNDIVTESQKLK